VDTNVVLPQPLPKKQLLGYNSFESRLALLPMTLVIMSSIISFTPELRNRFGIKRNLIIGLGLLAIGIV
jgi:cyanate permease